MPDIIEGLVLEVIDGEMLELEVEEVVESELYTYGARETIRVTDGNRADREDASNEETAALMALTYENRRVRCYIEERDNQGRLIADVEVLSAGEPSTLYGAHVDDTGED